MAQTPTVSLLAPVASAQSRRNHLPAQGVQLLMWNTRSVRLNVRLPNDVASEAEEVQRSDPDFLSRVIQYGLTRRSIYHRLRETEGRGASLVSHAPDSGSGFLRS